MKKSFSLLPLKSYVILITLHVFLAGCTTSYHLNTESFVPRYPRLTNPFPMNVALVVPAETSGFAFTVPMRRWEIGEAVSSHMASGLKAAFKDVVVLNDEKAPPKAERIVVCSLRKRTELKLGMLVTSDHTANIDLDCKVLDASRKMLWEGSILRSDTFNAGIIGQMLLLQSASSFFVKNVDVSGSVDMFHSVITSGSNSSLVLAVDQLMEKMISEGNTRICTTCSAKPDWRKTVAEQVIPEEDPEESY